MTNISTIKVDINNPAPSSYEVYSHELNYGLTRFIEVEFFSYSQPLDFTNVTVTATIVCNGYLVAGDISVTSVAENKVKMLISSTADYSILDGLMYIEFKFKEGNTELYPPIPVVINVKPSIRDNAQVTPESYGTVAKILQEVANARAGYPDLNARIATMNVQLHNIDNDQIKADAIHSENIKNEAVTNNKIVDGAVTEDKLAANAVTTAKIKDKAVTGAKIATGTIGTTNIGIGQVQTANIDGGAVTTSRIADEAITYEKLDAHSLLNTSTTSRPIYDDEHLPTAQFMKNYLTNRLCGKYSISFNSDNSIKNAESVTSLSAGSALGGAGVRSVYVSPTVNSINGSYASFTPDLKVLYVDKRADEITIDDYIKTDPHINIYYQGEFSVIDLLAKSQEADTKIDKPTKCIYFDEDDCVYTLTSGIHTGGPRVGITSVYAPSSITEIPDRALVSTPDLTTIYIDNASSAVTLGTDIQAAVNNEELIIYYKGQFNLANILATSQKKLNLRLISLEATVGTVNTILENAINGVS